MRKPHDGMHQEKNWWSALEKLGLRRPGVFLLGCAAIAAGLRYNGTRSLPVGLYLASTKHPEKGDLVFVDPPSLPIFTVAKERGYLNVAYCTVGRLLKRIMEYDLPPARCRPPTHPRAPSGIR